MSATRREFLKATALAGGGLVVGFRLDASAGSRDGGSVFRPNGWVKIDASGKVTLLVGKSEMGQGVRTSLPMILAEELEAEFAAIEVLQAAPSPEFPDLETSGSRSLKDGWLPLRKAGASAREMLVAAAAARWDVAADTCRAARGRVSHLPSGRSLGYGELVAAASRLRVPSDPPLKKPSDFRLVGRDTRRVDGPPILAGKPLYASDVRRPGMKFATVVRCPVLGGAVKSFRAETALAVPGVRLVAPISAGLAVVADDTWAALRGREALEGTIVWDEGPNAS
ncbi:MAG TPA: molybdopterin cofactor-binding domain-containing protein, partial [Thermoanaerobaculia bacterium]|nr:molybdopterin cofactor-binding domain-containing protein [Thermoanaerobaculia bacterium]